MATTSEGSTAWRAGTPPNGRVDEKYPQRSPTHFFMTPDYLASLLGEPNERKNIDDTKTTHAWNVTDGTAWVHVYNYKEECLFSMRGDTPDASARLREYIKNELE